MWLPSGFSCHGVAEVSKVDPKTLGEVFWWDNFVIADICWETAAALCLLTSNFGLMPPFKGHFSEGKLVKLMINEFGFLNLFFNIFF